MTDEAIELEWALARHLAELVRQLIAGNKPHGSDVLAVASYNTSTGYQDLDDIRNALSLPVILAAQSVLKAFIEGDEKPLAAYTLEKTSKRLKQLRDWNAYNHRGVEKRVRKGDEKDAQRVRDLIVEVQQEIDSLEPMEKWARENL